MKINLLATGLIVAVLAVTPVFAKTAFAQQNPDLSGSSLATIINRADAEINQKVGNLNEMLLRIETLQKISLAEQSLLVSSIQNEISQLNALKSKIDAEFNTQSAIIDYQAINDSYRIYNVMLPQLRIISASDRIMVIASSMNMIAVKISARTSSLTGIDSTAIKQKSSDFISKIVDASANSVAASAQVSKLKPKKTDSTNMQVSTSVLNGANLRIKTAIKDLAAARQDIADMATYLKESPANGQ